MPVYSYQALDAKGAEVTGTVTAPDDRRALGQVRELGLHPMDVRPQGTAAEASSAKHVQGGVKRRGRRVSPADLTLFTRQLANLVRGGLPMLRTLDALIENTEHERLFQVLSTVRDEVSGGKPLHEALAAHPRVFPPLYVSLVRSGELSGQLADVLTRLAQFQEQDLERRSQIRAALMYPILLLVVGSLIVFSLVTFLIPRFKVLFDEFGRALPMPTRIVMAVSTVMSRYWWAMLLAALLVGWVFRQWRRTQAGELLWDRWRLRWPLLGRLYVRSATARLARTMATLLHGGVSLLDTLEIVQGVVGNAALALGLQDVRTGVREGDSLAARLRATGMFPGLLAQMMLVGEETGDLESSLNTVADAFDVEVTNTLKGLVALVEPVIILVMGAIVAFVVFAMLMPIFQLNEGMM